MKYNTLTRAYFKTNRAPIYGMFVQLEDAEFLKAKGYVRFVIGGQIEFYEKATHHKEKYTKLYLISNFTYYKFYEPSISA